ncbi:hypothetical protein LMG28688_02614 [Paraburkholderia caffeinitolerans]|uniref:Uncharacterized protein n=1 Tax=Paraburkholderia caffeinitolerans TaxID=1723730 RepID=A0A6J5FZX3_9BURK|nr:hypothetical protein LMG28688_02614 [Paraburkholderia caffeinitolerans]
MRRGIDWVCDAGAIFNRERFDRVDICTGDFRHVCESFLEWKYEQLIYRKGHTMFEGRDEVHRLSKRRYEDASRHAKRYRMNVVQRIRMPWLPK